MTIKDKTDGGGSILLWLEFGGTKGRLQASAGASEHIIRVCISSYLSYTTCTRVLFRGLNGG